MKPRRKPWCTRSCRACWQKFHGANSLRSPSWRIGSSVPAQAPGRVAADTVASVPLDRRRVRIGGVDRFRGWHRPSSRAASSQAVTTGGALGVPSRSHAIRHRACTTSSPTTLTGRHDPRGLTNAEARRPIPRPNEHSLDVHPLISVRAPCADNGRAGR